MTDLEGAPASAVDDEAAVGFSPLADDRGFGAVGGSGSGLVSGVVAVLGSPAHRRDRRDGGGSLAGILLIVSIIGAARAAD